MRKNFMENIVVLNVNFNFGYGEDTIYPVILQDEDEMILVDCGYTIFLSLLEKAAYEKGIDLSKLT
ncbi:MAG: MBL fold metallo-hydrolase, partial [Clostridium sp.]|nr:MBL fold metallo-hydrolase [Clostridium sp.]